MYNKKELKKTERSAVKSNPWAKDRVVIPGAPKVDPNGYWDPANIGRIIEVPSPIVTMQNVEEPLVGVGSDTGIAQYMTEGNEYTFPYDSSVIEYPAKQYMELTDDEIAEYKAGGYVVEEEEPKGINPPVQGDPNYERKLKAYNRYLEHVKTIGPELAEKTYRSSTCFDDYCPAPATTPVNEDIKLPTKKAEPINIERPPNEIFKPEPVANKVAKQYDPGTGKWVDVIIPADSDYDQRTLEREAFRQKNLEYQKLQGLKKVPESSHDVSEYQFANGGYIADETYYPPKHNPANSFAVNDPRSMQTGGNYFSYAGRPDAKYMKKDDGWYINAPGTNDQYVKVEDPTGKRTKLLNEQAVYHSGDKAKKAQSSVVGNAMHAAQDVFNPINDDILKVGESVSGGGYNKAFAGSGTPFVITHNGQEILPAATSGTYCSGYTCGVTMKAMQQRGMLNEMTPEQLKNFQKTWYGAKGFEKGKSETLSVKALEDYNLGKGIKHDEAKAGDIAQIWRENGSGHSVIFKDWVTDKNGKKIGIKYRSSQPSTGGIGDRTEMFGTKINPERIYLARLNSHSKGGYVDAQMTHFQSGGNTDPGNNALELHMFYDKDVYKKEDGGDLPEAQNGIVIADPKEYAYRKAAYEDSLSGYNKTQDVLKALDNLPIKHSSSPNFLNKHAIYSKADDALFKFMNTHSNIKPSSWKDTEEYLGIKGPQPYSLRVGIPVYKKPVQPISKGLSSKEITTLPLLPVKQVDQASMLNNYIPIDDSYNPSKDFKTRDLRFANRSQTLMEPDPNRPGKFKVKDLRSVPYSMYEQGHGWELLDTPRVMYYNPTTGEETTERFQEGGGTGNYFTVAGSDGVYRKVNGKWQVDWNRSGNFQPLSKGDLAKRTAVLNKQAKPLYDVEYNRLVESRNYKTAPKQLSAQQNFNQNFKVSDKDDYTKVKDRINSDKEKLLQWSAENNVPIDQKQLDDYETWGWNVYGKVGAQRKPNDLRSYEDPNYTFADKVGNVLRNPLVAATYFMQPGDFNMPMNYSELERSPEYNDPLWNRNAVGQAANFARYFHPVGLAASATDNTIYTLDDTEKALESGKAEDWQRAGYSGLNTALDLVGSRYISNSGRLLNAGERATLEAMNTSNKLGLNTSVNSFLGNKVFPNFSAPTIRSADNLLQTKIFPQLNPMSTKYDPLTRKLYNTLVTVGNTQNIKEAFGNKLNQKKDGGHVGYYSNEEIEEMRRQGYIVEEE